MDSIFLIKLSFSIDFPHHFPRVLARTRHSRRRAWPADRGVSGRHGGVCASRVVFRPVGSRASPDPPRLGRWQDVSTASAGDARLPAGGAQPGPAPAPTHPLPARSPGELVRAWVVPGPGVAVLSTGTALGTLGSGFWALELRPQLSARAAARPAPRPGAPPALSNGAPLRGTRRGPRRYPAEWRRRPRQSFASPRRRGSACAPPVPAASRSLLLQAARVCVSLSC